MTQTQQHTTVPSNMPTSLTLLPRMEQWPITPSNLALSPTQSWRETTTECTYLQVQNLWSQSNVPEWDSLSLARLLLLLSGSMWNLRLVVDTSTGMCLASQESRTHLHSDQQHGQESIWKTKIIFSSPRPTQPSMSTTQSQAISQMEELLSSSTRLTQV